MKWVGIAGLICAGVLTVALISNPPQKNRLWRECEAILRRRKKMPERSA